MKRLLPLAIAACQGTTGTIDLQLTTAPGSTLLDGVQHLRVTLSDPLTVIEADRGDSGFDLALDVEATGGPATLTVEGLDGGGSLIAAGASPAFAVSAIDARIVIYMAAPLSIEPAPTKLPAARTGVASTPLSYGLVMAGGKDATTVTDEIFIYNIFDHTLLAGLPMPEPRAFQSIATGSNNAVYLFGGDNVGNEPTGTAWRFDTNARPNGSYAIGPVHAELARRGELALSLSVENIIITGMPPLDFDFGNPVARTDQSVLAASGAAVVVDGTPVALFAGDPIVRLTGDTFDTIPATAASIDPAAALSDGRIVFAVGNSIDVLVVDPVSGSSTTLPILSVPRLLPAVGATDRFIVVAGGSTGDPVELAPTADVIDAQTLTRIATVRCHPRNDAQALAMPNGQIVIVGGEPANDVIELFTPPP